MRFIDDARRAWSVVTSRAVLPTLMACWLGLPAGCSRAPSPTAPDPKAHAFLGRWAGVVVSDVIGAGSAVVTIDAVTASAVPPLLTGTWSFTFAQPEFSGQGTVEGSVDTLGERIDLFLSRGTVPCPDAPGGAASRVMAVTLVLARERLTGPYVLAGCPGGRLDLGR